MKKNLIILVLVFSLVLLGGQQASAAATAWQFDTAHSRFYFTIDHIYAKVIGYFEDFSGTVHFDRDNLQESSFNIEIKTKSINTNIRKRDNHLRSDDFFEVKKYPLISFVSKGITHKGGDQYEVEGDFTMKDVTKTIVLPLTYFGARDNPLKEGQVVAGFETRLTVNRLDYHVGSGKFHQMGVAGKDVDITVSLEMVRDK
jgi:polyisoprenoid-binding protein YceI